MARPRKFKERTREYLANLVYDEGITERKYVALVIQGTKSPDSTERTRCMEMLQNWLGFKDADKRVSEAIGELTIANISKDDLVKLATPMEDRCATCKHQYCAKDTQSIVPQKEESQDEPSNKEAVNIDSSVQEDAGGVDKTAP